MAELSLNGTVLEYEDTGSGGPPLLFVHGWACDRSCWQSQVAEFSRDHRCVTVDLRGRGGSRPVPPFGVGQALEDVAALVRELSLAPVILVGHSLGGIISLALNGRYPELVLGVVTIDSPITSETGAGSPRSVTAIREAGSMHAVERF
ncbi:MAG: alpha/beta hydrolase, partial [bacterium]